MKTVGERIKDLRTKNNMTQKDLAEKLDMDPSLLTRIEKNQRPVKNKELTKIAKIFNASIDYLLTGEYEKDDKQRLVDLLYQKTLDKKILWYDGIDTISNDLDDFIDICLKPYAGALRPFKYKYCVKNKKLFIFISNDRKNLLLYGDYLNPSEYNIHDFNIFKIDSDLEQLYEVIFEPEKIFEKEKTNEFIDFLDNL